MDELQRRIRESWQADTVDLIDPEDVHYLLSLWATDGTRVVEV